MSPGTRQVVGLAAFGFVLVALCTAELAFHVHGATILGSASRARRFVSVLALSAIVYAAACAFVLRHDGGRRGLAVVLVVACAIRVPALCTPPFLSSDLFRYVWDGRVQLAGINPYRFVPADPALASLRDDAIYPHVNRRGYAHTIYPPAAQLMFRAVAAIAQTARAMKIAAVLCEALAILCLVRLLVLAGLPPARVLIYAWNPLAVWSFAGNGHVDVEAIAFVALALLLRATRRDGAAGAALTAAALVKFLPVAIAPALWRGRWRFAVVAIATCGALYAPFVDIGWRGVFGFLGGYGNEEGMQDGSGIWFVAGLRHLATLPAGAVPLYLAISAVGLAALALTIARSAAGREANARARAAPDAREIVRVADRAGLLAVATMTVLSPHYSWYFPWIGVFAVLSPRPAFIWMSAASLALDLCPWHEFFLWPSIVYVPTLVLLLVDWLAARPAARPAIRPERFSP